MRRRDFLKVVGLSVATPSFLVAEEGPPPKRQNPDFISTGFPTIDDCFGGGWHRGTFNMVYRRVNTIKFSNDLRLSILLKSMALKAASDLNKRSSVLFVCNEAKTVTTLGTPFDGLLTISNKPPKPSEFKYYDLIMFDEELKVYKEGAPQWKDITVEARWFHQMAHEHNCVIVKRGKIGYPDSYSSNLTAGMSQMYLASSGLIFDTVYNPSHGSKSTLEVFKNRWGKSEKLIYLDRPSIHFFEESKYVMNSIT